MKRLLRCSSDSRRLGDVSLIGEVGARVREVRLPRPSSAFTLSSMGKQRELSCGSCCEILSSFAGQSAATKEV